MFTSTIGQEDVPNNPSTITPSPPQPFPSHRPRGTGKYRHQYARAGIAARRSHQSPSTNFLRWFRGRLIRATQNGYFDEWPGCLSA